MIDAEEVMDRQDAFIGGILEEYGDQTFWISGAELVETIADIHHRADAHGLYESVPAAMSELMQDEPHDGTYEIIIRKAPEAGRYLVGVFIIFPEDE